MSASLTTFLLDLAQDPQKTEAFKQNPKQTMMDAGLSEDDQSLLLSGNPQAIQQAIDTEKLGASLVTIIFISVIFD